MNSNFDFLIVSIVILIFMVVIGFIRRDQKLYEDDNEPTIYENPYNYERMDKFFNKIKKFFKRKKQ